MDARYIVVILVFAGVECHENKLSQLCFPPYFLFGVATAAYQIEGAWNTSGKGESIWDRYTHEHAERIFDHQTGDVTDDSYHNFKDDVALIADLGLSFYRFSISWPRILPDGFSNNVNEDGVRYYDALLSELDKHNLKPLVTIYHWDLPQDLQDLGGWTNPLIADYFEDYARVLFNIFGDRVQNWITVNEPYSFCHDGYGGNDAPGARASGVEDYMCAHNALIAHARVYHMYKREFSHKQNGAVGIVLDMAWMEPNTTSQEDAEAAETAMQFYSGWFAHPIFSTSGDYPPVMRQRIDKNSHIQGFRRSRLPTFTPEQVASIRGSYDFLGLNHYTTYVVTPGPTRPHIKPFFADDSGVVLTQRDEWPKSNSTWLRIVPWGFRKLLNWVKNSYNNPPILITENGISTPAGLRDVKRVQYIASYLKSLHSAVVKDNCQVYAYTHWSLIDNFEWTRGLSERFGLYEVDYLSPSRTRTARLSAAFYKQIAKTGCIPENVLDFL